MKLVNLRKGSILLALVPCLAFVARSGRHLATNQCYWPMQGSSKSYVLRSICYLAVDQVAEPVGGEELMATATAPGTRMKKMNEVTDVKSEDGSPVYQFWMTSQVQGTLIKEIRTQILKDASRKANFPGFRKGQVPPYAQPQITSFSLQEAIIKTVEATTAMHGLKPLSGSDGEFEVHEDVKEMAKVYKIGESVQFTASMKATFDPEKQLPMTIDAIDAPTAVDAEVVDTDN